MITSTINHHTTQKESAQFLSSLSLWVEKNRFSFMATSIVLGSAWGSVAMYYIMQNHLPIYFLILCTVFTMAGNALNIAQVSAKWVLISTLLSLIANSILTIASIV